jgi:hypothetical protein
MRHETKAVLFAAFAGANASSLINATAEVITTEYCVRMPPHPDKLLGLTFD